MVDVFQPLWLQSLYFIDKFNSIQFKLHSGEILCRDVGEFVT
jgi:hypothetical protein